MSDYYWNRVPWDKIGHITVEAADLQPGTWVLHQLLKFLWNHTKASAWQYESSAGLGVSVGLEKFAGVTGGGSKIWLTREHPEDKAQLNYAMVGGYLGVGVSALHAVTVAGSVYDMPSFGGLRLLPGESDALHHQDLVSTMVGPCLQLTIEGSAAVGWSGSLLFFGITDRLRPLIADFIGHFKALLELSHQKPPNGWKERVKQTLVTGWKAEYHSAAIIAEMMLLMQALRYQSLYKYVLFMNGSEVTTGVGVSIAAAMGAITEMKWDMPMSPKLAEPVKHLLGKTD
jgi:hypothetical protein